MKHAIMVIGYGKYANVLQKTINVLDDYDIDFFIHWDKRYKLPKLKSHKSKIFFINDRIAVKWGSATLVKATIKLMRTVDKREKYDYVHLISSNDMPLMTVEYFKAFFVKNAYIGFADVKSKTLINRLRYYYPNDIDFRKHGRLAVIIMVLNRLIGINRLKGKNLKIEKGPEWFSCNEKYIKEILSEDLNVFFHAYCADELMVQTILSRFKPLNYKIVDDCEQAARYIDWTRGGPYMFNENDVDELIEVVNTRYAFARKINNSNLIDLVFDNY